MMAKQAYGEGSVCAIPLSNGGHARGVIARCDGKGLAFGYFFGPCVDNVAKLDVTDLCASKAMLVGQFSDLGIRSGSWTIIGRVEDWSRDEWPMPSFVSDTDNPESVMLTEYDDDTLNARSSRLALRSSGEAMKAPIDEVMGYRLLEVQLARLLAASS